MRAARSLGLRDDAHPSCRDCQQVLLALPVVEGVARVCAAARIGVLPAVMRHALAAGGRFAADHLVADERRPVLCSKGSVGRYFRRYGDSCMSLLAFLMNFPQAADCPDNGLG